MSNQAQVSVNGDIVEGITSVEVKPSRTVDRTKYPFVPMTDRELMAHAALNPPKTPWGHFKMVESIPGSGKNDLKVYVPPPPFIYANNARKRVRRALKKAERLEFVQREARRRKLRVRDIRISTTENQ